MATTQPSVSPLSLPPTPPSLALAPINPASYISPTSLPSAPPLLFRSPSRTSLPPQRPSPTRAAERSSHPPSRLHSRRPSSSSLHFEGQQGGGSYEADSSWLTRTASALAMQCLEEKGQSWIVSRKSATSLQHHQNVPSETYHGSNRGEEKGATDEGGNKYYQSNNTTPTSRHSSRMGSKVGSRVGSRAASRLDLRMTGLATPSIETKPAPQPPTMMQDLAGMEPDFVDLPNVDDDDSGELAVVDEGELKKLVLGRVEGWVEWLVGGWMDLREGGGGGGVGGQEQEEKNRSTGEEKGREEGRKGLDVEGEKGLARIPPAPPWEAGGIWADAKWLARIARESL
ncbi:MAG: hypothetical protein Q9220_003990 [cf. Caloplaca sp. 1 TL-2023]